MKIHENNELFGDAIAAAAQQFGIQEIYIEKDYWITVALHRIFHAPIGSYVVFKGGTALSKAHHLVERFSEDVDLVIVRNADDSGSRLKSKLKAISTAVIDVLPELEVEGITNKLGMIRKTAHSYPKGNYQGIYGQVREFIVLESTWLGNFEPYVTRAVDCYISKMLTRTGQQEMIVKYNMAPFEVRALSVERTLCEKIMSLVRFSQTEYPITDLRNKIRHIYDLHMILKSPEYSAFFDSPAVETLLLQVATDDIQSFKNNNAWLANHPKDVLIFAAVEQTWEQLKATYQGNFKDLILGNLPTEADILTTLKKIATRLDAINWSIDPAKLNPQ